VVQSDALFWLDCFFHWLSPPASLSFLNEMGGEPSGGAKGPTHSSPLTLDNCQQTLNVYVFEIRDAVKEDGDSKSGDITFVPKPDCRSATHVHCMITVVVVERAPI
jgi:hypothetical protein